MAPTNKQQGGGIKYWAQAIRGQTERVRRRGNPCWGHSPILRPEPPQSCVQLKKKKNPHQKSCQSANTFTWCNLPPLSHSTQLQPPSLCHTTGAEIRGSNAAFFFFLTGTKSHFLFDEKKKTCDPVGYLWHLAGFAILYFSGVNQA